MAKHRGINHSRAMSAEPPILPAVSVALVRGDTVLLVKRGRPPVQGLYAFPGGKVDPGESFEDAARRELHEETGLLAESLRFIEEIITPAEPVTGMPSFRLRVFAAGSAKGELAAADDAEEAAFFSRAELDRLPLADRVHDIAVKLFGGV